MIRPLRVAAVIAALITLCGCTGYHEIEEMSIVSGIAIDKGNDDRYSVTFQYISISTDAGSGITPRIIQAHGSSVLSAVKNASRASDGRVYFSNCQSVIIGQELADEGISPLLDWMTRDYETRITMRLFVAKGCSAGEVLTPKKDSNEVTAFTLKNMSVNCAKTLGKSPDVTLHEATEAIHSKGTCLLLPTVTVEKFNGEQTPVIEGCAVFDGDRRIAYLSGEDTFYLLCARNKIKASVLVTDSGDNSRNVSLEILSSESFTSISENNPEPHFCINIENKASYSEESSFDSPIKEYGISEVELWAERTITNNVNRLIKSSREDIGVDIFNLGQVLFLSSSPLYREYEKDWKGLLDRVPVKVSANVVIGDTQAAIPLK